MNYKKEVIVNEKRRGLNPLRIKDWLTKKVALSFKRYIKFFRFKIPFSQSIKIFAKKEHLEKLSEADPNEISVPMRYRDFCKYSISLTFTVTYLLIRIFGFSILNFQIFFYKWDVRLLYVYRLLFILLAVIITIIYILLLSGQQIYRHKQLDIKVINDISPLDKIVRYTSFISILLLTYEFFVFVAKTVSRDIYAQWVSGEYLEVIFDTYWYAVFLCLFILHLFLTFTLVNVSTYLGGGYKLSLKHAAKGLLELERAENIYFGIEEYYKEHPE